MGMGPISVLTLATLAGIGRDPDLRRVSVAMMGEAVAVGEALGLHMDITHEARVDLGAELGEIKTSMLQEPQRARPMEITALPAVVCEIGLGDGVATPQVKREGSR